MLQLALPIDLDGAGDVSDGSSPLRWASYSV
jgi:hypothetical protein